MTAPRRKLRCRYDAQGRFWLATDDGFVRWDRPLVPRPADEPSHVQAHVRLSGAETRRPTR